MDGPRPSCRHDAATPANSIDVIWPTGTADACRAAPCDRVANHRGVTP